MSAWHSFEERIREVIEKPLSKRDAVMEAQFILNLGDTVRQSRNESSNRYFTAEHGVHRIQSIFHQKFFFLSGLRASA
jgi:hypothetical protein